MSCHEGDQLVVSDLHLTSYSTLLLVPVLAANYLVLFSGSFPQNGSTGGTFPSESVTLLTLYLVWTLVLYYMALCVLPQGLCHEIRSLHFLDFEIQFVTQQSLCA